MIEGLKNIFRGLGDEYYFFVFLDSIFVWGIGLGLLFFIASLIFKEKKSQNLALVIIFLSSAAVYPYLENREDARDGFEANWKDRTEKFDEQTERRQSTQYYFYGLAALALATLILKNKIGVILSIATIIAAILVFVLSMWLHLKESEVYHPSVTNAIRK